MKIAIAVHGRFHAFDLARELSRQHDVTIFTNYPKWAARRFGIAPETVRAFWLHGVLMRAAWWLHEKVSLPFPEAALHRLFGRWAAREIGRDKWDVIHSFSGISEEILLGTKKNARLHMLVRGSAHIRAQARILKQEERRTGVMIDRPSRWMIAREEREYALADRIYVLSTFAWTTFVNEGIDRQKLYLVPHGAQPEDFRPEPGAVESRCARILSGEPLHILFVGTLSFRKGLFDIAALLRTASRDRFRFRLVGAVTKAAQDLTNSLHDVAEVMPKQPQHELPASYAWGDVFVFPTIEDGFAVVLAQASAAALPILTTTNCCGPDLIRENQTGWVLPICNAGAFEERLHWCDTHREELAAMVRRIYEHFHPRTWADTAADFVAACTDFIQINGSRQAI